MPAEEGGYRCTSWSKRDSGARYAEASQAGASSTAGAARWGAPWPLDRLTNVAANPLYRGDFDDRGGDAHLSAASDTGEAATLDAAPQLATAFAAHLAGYREPIAIVFVYPYQLAARLGVALTRRTASDASSATEPSSRSIGGTRVQARQPDAGAHRVATPFLQRDWDMSRFGYQTVTGLPTNKGFP